MAIQTIDPYLVDLNLVSSIDLQANLTDYVTVLEEFINEASANSVYWHTNSHSDPTTSKINFFATLATGGLQLKDNPDGVKKRDVTPKQLHNKNYRDQLPSGTNLKTNSGGKYGEPALNGETTAQTYKRVTTREWVNAGNDDDQKVTDIGKWETKTQNVEDTHPVAPLSDTQKSNPEPDASYGLAKMSAWFKMWWIEKYNTAHQVIKRDLKELLGEGNEYYTSFSESVGQIKNLQDYYDNCTLPVWDTSFATGIPATENGVARYAMKNEALTLSKNLSKQTNKLYRFNMRMMMEDASKDTLDIGPLAIGGGMSHGSNLVCDQSYINKVVNSMELIHITIQNHLMGLYDVLDMLSDRRNHMVVNKPKQILMKVEDFTTGVGRLKNRINSYRLDRDKAAPASTFGKKAVLNQNKTNAERLGVPGTTESSLSNQFL